jgi:hypothetical protein
MLATGGPLGTAADMWYHGFLFAPALTVGGGTGEVQRNIVAERVLGLPHDTDVETGLTWTEAQRRAPVAG